MRSPPPVLSLLALSLTAVAGYVDAVGFLTLDHLYTANMSGNSVKLGNALALLNLATVSKYFVPIAWFFVGLLAGSALQHAFNGPSRRRAIIVPLALEIALFLAYLLVDQTAPAGAASAGLRFPALVGLVAAAMGLQNATLRKVGGLSIHTTHVTGTLLQAADQLVSAVAAVIRNRAQPLGRRLAGLPRDAGFREALLFLALWLVYVLGAAAALLLCLKIGAWSILAPAAVLLAWIAAASARSLPFPPQQHS